MAVSIFKKYTFDNFFLFDGEIYNYSKKLHKIQLLVYYQLTIYMNNQKFCLYFYQYTVFFLFGISQVTNLIYDIVIMEAVPVF